MNREEVLSQYRLIRAGIRRVLRLAPAACNKADLTRAIKQIIPWADANDLGKGEVAERITDVALFERNQRGRRAYDRFLEQQAQELDAADRALAQSMADAWFSIFRVAERHATAGLWLEDLLDGDRRIWIVDEAMEASAGEGTVLGMRLFDAGPFHAGFGIVAMPNEETVHFAVIARKHGDPLPFRQSLAATLYGDALRAEQPFDAGDIALMENLFKILQPPPGGADQASPGKARPRKPARSKRKPSSARSS